MTIVSYFFIALHIAAAQPQSSPELSAEAKRAHEEAELLQELAKLPTSPNPQRAFISYGLPATVLMLGLGIFTWTLATRPR